MTSATVESKLPATWWTLVEQTSTELISAGLSAAQVRTRLLEHVDLAETVYDVTRAEAQDAINGLVRRGIRERHGLVIVGADEFAAFQFPPREYLLAPFFQEKNLGMIYGPRGVGKTLIGAGVSLAASTAGPFLRWNAPKARRVLYIDGELPQETLQKRIRDVAGSIGVDPPPTLRLLTPDQQGAARIPNLADPEGQRIIEDYIDAEDAELVILDNLSTLCRSGEENAAESWQVIQDWLVLLRSHRRSVLMLHHSGKSGDQRGTSKREDVLDCSLRIVRPSDYTPEQGARFEVHFEKAREPFGDAVAPFEARLEGEAWTTRGLTAARDAMIVRLKAEGYPQREIAREAGCSLGTVNSVLRKRSGDEEQAS